MERALEWLAREAHARPRLEEAAAVVGLGPHHFQRLFSRWAGVSPKQFLQAVSLARAQSRLDAGASVLDAALEAGLSGPGRLHDAFVTVEAVTPGEYKRGLAGTTIHYGYAPSPFGECLIMSTGRGICALGFVCWNERDVVLADLAGRFPRARLRRDDAQALALAARIFRNPGACTSRQTPLRLFLAGTRFQIQVWRALLAIPQGAVTSYEELARRIDKPRAVRAVGTANGANPIAYLVPCHRVIRKTGALGGYRWGLGRKLALLGTEALRAQS
jgi:AraC family transcriptional regulator of adaptative response/methylated-DNA-[protein]-cysteine methyltransferase